LSHRRRRPIIAQVIRRVHISRPLVEGSLDLDRPQAHHVRNVLRLSAGDTIEVFDDRGTVAQAAIEQCDAAGVRVRVGQVERLPQARPIIIASAVPKGDRADWMIEKLSELGVARFVPLQTARSVVHPKGQSKLERWRRIATESSKQSRRAGVMRIDELTRLEDALGAAQATSDAAESPAQSGLDRRGALYLSTAPDAVPILSASSFIVPRSSLVLFIGPEGGWTDEELARFTSAGLTGVKLTATILRVETAAVAAAVVAAVSASGDQTYPAGDPQAVRSGSTRP
jgi:16S rRNA (uracil1498-N3)-methyltransferase